MCLGIPGKVVDVERTELGLAQGRVDFGGIVKKVNLSFTPEVEPGQFVVVHVGFAIATLDEDEAARAIEHLRELGELDRSLREARSGGESS